MGRRFEAISEIATCKVTGYASAHLINHAGLLSFRRAANLFAVRGTTDHLCTDRIRRDEELGLIAKKPVIRHAY